MNKTISSTDRIKHLAEKSRSRNISHSYASSCKTVRASLSQKHMLSQKHAAREIKATTKNHSLRGMIVRAVSSNIVASVFLLCFIFFLSAVDVSAFTLTGIVSSPFGPVEKANVHVYDTKGVSAASGVTDANGHFSVIIGSAGTYNIRISRSGFYENTRLIELTDNTVLPKVILSPYPFVIVKGFLRSSTRVPISGGLIQAKHGKVIIDETFSEYDGYYQIRVMDSSEYIVQAAADSYYTSNTIFPTDGNRDLDIYLSPTSFSTDVRPVVRVVDDADEEADSGSETYSEDNRVWCGDTRCDREENCKNCAKDCGICESAQEMVGANLTAVKKPIPPALQNLSMTDIGIGSASLFMRPLSLEVTFKAALAIVTLMAVFAFGYVLKKHM